MDAISIDAGDRVNYFVGACYIGSIHMGSNGDYVACSEFNDGVRLESESKDRAKAWLIAMHARIRKGNRNV